MKGLTLLAVLPATVWAAAFSQAEYDSGAVHERIMKSKHSAWDSMRAAGDLAATKWKSFTGKGPVKCINGLATVVPGDPLYTFRCDGMDFYDFKSHSDLGSIKGEGSNTWGWVSDTGREFIAVGQGDGAAFAEITKDGKLSYLGRLPQQSKLDSNSIWREMKSYKNYMVIGSESVNHGVQFFDMKKLLTLDPAKPKNFSTTSDLAGWFNDLPAGRSHNVVVNEELGYAVAVGAQPRNTACASGLIYINITNIAKPYSPGCSALDGYVHDAQCVKYRGPDKKYNGRDICYGYNEDTLTIYDATNKVGKDGKASSIISRTTYTGASYTHQGWTIDSQWQEYLLMNDEYDEEEARGPAADGYPVTFIWDIRSLEKPKITGYYKHPNKGIDHNLYVKNGLATLSNYGAGLAVLDVSGVPQDPTGGNIKRVGWFDIHPEDDKAAGGGRVEFVGTWGHYAFPSGYIFVNTIERGGFVVKLNK